MIRAVHIYMLIGNIISLDLLACPTCIGTSAPETRPDFEKSISYHNQLITLRKQMPAQQQPVQFFINQSAKGKQK